MGRIASILVCLAALLAVGCRDTTPQPAATPQPSVAPSPRAAGAAIPIAPAASPGATIPPSIMERVGRPLTREEILKLPPEKRDPILRAIGQTPPPASPAPKASPATRKP